MAIGKVTQKLSKYSAGILNMAKLFFSATFKKPITGTKEKSHKPRN